MFKALIITLAILASTSAMAQVEVASIDQLDLIDGITIDIEDRTLFYTINGEVVFSGPVAVARTPDLIPRGWTTVVDKRAGFTWTPTPNMMARNPNLRPIGPGPDNPMGEYLLDIDTGGEFRYIRIHGTNDETSIGQAASSGCFRMYNDDIRWLYNNVPENTTVWIR